jgi:hypothetical protein
VASSEIHSIQSISGNQPRIRRIIEEAGQSFLPGTPVSITAADGGVAAWNGTWAATPIIAGFSKEAGAGLATTGVAQQQTFGSVPNESAAVNISRPYFNDGRNGFECADQDTVFLGQVGPSQTCVPGDVGKQYGLTKDADGHWYVDKTKATPGTNTVLTVVKLDPNDQSASPRGVYFVMLASVAQVVA